MKTKKRTELDVDFIGGMGPLTKDEEKKISEFIRARKAKQRLVSEKSSRKVTSRKKISV